MFNFSNILPLIVVPPPVFVDCPQTNVSIDLPPGLNRALVQWRVPTAVDDKGDPVMAVLVKGQMTPANLGPGIYEVEYEAATEAGSVASCQFVIEVYGKCYLFVFSK